MKFTSISHCERSNFQVDYSGPRLTCIIDFGNWCRNNDVIWAHLFDEETGELVHTFKREK